MTAPATVHTGFESPQQEIRVLREAAAFDRDVIAALRRDIADKTQRIRDLEATVRAVCADNGVLRAARDAADPDRAKVSDE